MSHGYETPAYLELGVVGLHDARGPQVRFLLRVPAAVAGVVVGLVDGREREGGGGAAGAEQARRGRGAGVTAARAQVYRQGRSGRKEFVQGEKTRRCKRI